MGQIDKWVIVFFALPISPIGSIGLISPIFNAFYGQVSFSIPMVVRGLFLCGWCFLFVLGVVFNTRDSVWGGDSLCVGYCFQYLWLRGCATLMGWVSFSIPVKGG